MSLTRRLVTGLLLVVGAFVLLTVLSLDRRLRDRLRHETSTELLREARLVAAQWSDSLDPDSLADAAGRALDHRVTLIRHDGVVVGDSEFDGEALARLENHAARPEVSNAWRTDTGTSVRTSPSAGDVELYAAARARQGVARVSVSMEAQEQLVGRVQRDVITVALIGTALALLLAVLFARSVARPVLELRDDARAIAAGDLSRRPSLHAPGEVGELAIAFHRLAEQLEGRLRALEADEALLRALTESLHEGTVALDQRGQVVHLNLRARDLLGVRDATPFPADRLPRDRILRTAVDAALAGSVTEGLELTLRDRTVALTARPLSAGGAVLALLDLTPIRRLELVRRDFVANVSHELRTPLTVVRGFAETLLDESLSPDQRRQFATAIATNTYRMQRIVDDLLDLSRIESGRWQPEPVALDFDAAAADALATIRPAAEERGVALVIEPGEQTVVADPTALRQILSNLLENAIRYTAGGSITVFSCRERDGVEIGVRDTGSGIAPEHLPRIFERFYRADPGRSRSEGGTGLGLAIVRHLTETHGGRVRAESTVGVGTTIAVWLPNPP